VRQRRLFGAAVILAAAPIVFAATPAGPPQGDATAARIQALEAGQRDLQRQVQSLQKQIEELKALLLARGAGSAGPPPLANVTLPAGGATRGNPKAKLTIIEYTDFECPFCARYARESYPALMKEYVDTGKVRYVVRHLPLESIHPNAREAARAAECARQQGRFDVLHDRLFANPKALGRADLERTAGAIGLDVAVFRRCLDNPATDAVVSRDLEEARRVGISATPSFVFGLTQPDGSVRALRSVSGAQPYAVFKAAIEGLLAGQ
jgi:protein-disulfide isomerase